MEDIIIGRDDEDRKLFGTAGTIVLGKHYVKMGQTSSLANNVMLDMIRPHVIMLCGKRGGGKSYTMGVIAEGLANMPIELKKNISIILLDTMGVYWTMKYENHKEFELLKPYGLEPKGFNIKIFTPHKFYKKYKEEGIPTDHPFAIKPSELDAVDWCLALGVDITSNVGVLLEKTIMTLKDQGKNYSIKDMAEHIMRDDSADKLTKDALSNRLLSTEAWGLFDEKGTKMSDLARGGEVIVLDVSCYATMENGWNVKSLVVGMVSQKMFIERLLHRKNEEFDEINATRNLFSNTEDVSKKQQDVPLVWLVIDEAHEFLPREGKTAASDALIAILREGRQPGISLILATQQPGKIHTDVLTQADTVIAHRMTAKIDTEALGILMQSYMRKGLDLELDSLPRVKGTALIFDDTNEKLYQIRVRPRMSWHGGSSPTALKQKKEGF
ncbi:ATP-binding protein [Candidatus Woesearchaeota archaeon]|nr:ATP-binding protein [Candidatus Woesearchaeota archaeon]